MNLEVILRLLFSLSLTGTQIVSENIDPSTIFGSPSLSTRKKGDTDAAAGSRCTQDICVSIFKCEKLFAIYSNVSAITPKRKQSLREALCGWNMGAPLVCCENELPAVVTESLVTAETRQIIVDQQCGKNPLNKNIVRVSGGKNSTLGAWPWMAALFFRDTQTGSTKFGCGGSLIARDWVLTAAHCIPTSWGQKLEYVRLGDLDLNPEVEDGANPIEVQVKGIIKHPKYSREPTLNDIALLHLEESVTFTPYISPICLHSAKEYVTNATIYDKKKPVVAGWGDTAYLTHTTTHLLEVDLKIVPLESCNKSYDNFVQRGEMKLDETVLCSYAPEKDACQGDSGGPLMFIGKGGVWSQGGIVSYGYECAREGYPGVYTRVAAFIDWINTSTGLKF